MNKVLIFSIFFSLFVFLDIYSQMPYPPKHLNAYKWNNKMVDEGDSLLIVCDTATFLRISKATYKYRFVDISIPKYINNGDEYKSYVFSVSKDRTDQIYIGIWDQIYLLNSDNSVESLLGNDVEYWNKSSYYQAVTFDKNNTMYAAGIWPYVISINKASVQFVDTDIKEWYPSGWYYEFATLNCDSVGDVWSIVSSGDNYSVINKYNKDKNIFELKLKITTSSWQPVNGSVVDNNNNLWFTHGSNIRKYSCNTGGIGTYNHATMPEIPDVQFTSISKDKRGNLWFCADNLLMKYDGTNFVTYKNIGLKNAQSLLCDDGGIWIYRSDEMLSYSEGGKTCRTISIRKGNGVEGQSNVETVAINIAKPYAMGRRIVVPNATDEVVVYDVMGRVVGRSEGRNNAVTIDVLTSGVYVVKMGGDVQKVVAR